MNGHFRGGRNTEVTYMVDGVQVDESFGGVVLRWIYSLKQSRI